MAYSSPTQDRIDAEMKKVVLEAMLGLKDFPQDIGSNREDLLKMIMDLSPDEIQKTQAVRSLKPNTKLERWVKTHRKSL